MHPFFLSLPSKQQTPSINYTSKLFLIGSCFVENIGEYLDYYKFQNLINPFGIVFHPQAILNILNRIVTQSLFTEKDIFYHNEQWHCFEVHSKLSDSDKNSLLNRLNNLLVDTHKWITEVSHIVITYGTAWGYEYNQNIVANCHKIPQKEFSKKLSTVGELQTCIENSIAVLKTINSKVSILFTVSPVRHIKDGIVENNQSKAHLLTAVHRVVETNKELKYYPAYELMMDCLRDYRFYKPDLIHPNETAIQYIWEHFKETWLYQNETTLTIKHVEEIQRGLAHKPFNRNSDAHKKFKVALDEKIVRLKNRHSFINFNQ